MKLSSIALLVLLTVFMFAPLLLISRSEIQHFQTWFERLGMESQALLYGVLRIIAYPYKSDLQDALLSIHGIVGSLLVVTIGEFLGSGTQLMLFECAYILWAAASCVLHDSPGLNICVTRCAPVDLSWSQGKHATS